MPAPPPTRQVFSQRQDEVRGAAAEATMRLAELGPFKEISVEQIAREAGINRSAFYAHFRGKNDALMAAAESVMDEFYLEADRWWHGEGEPEAIVREALDGVATAYASHSGLLRVVTEVSGYDEEFARFWRDLINRFIEASADYFRREQAAGAIRDFDAVQMATALVWMVERCCYIQLARGDLEPGAVIDSLMPTWMGAIYLR